MRIVLLEQSYLQAVGLRLSWLKVARWLTDRASDLRIVDTRFDSPPCRCRVKTLGKFLTPSCNVVIIALYKAACCVPWPTQPSIL